MRLALPGLIAIIALLVTACSAVTPRAALLDGPTATITVATATNGTGSLGVPFVDGLPVVETVGVTITGIGLAEPIELRFTVEDDVYSYDPDGAITTIAFGFTGAVTVALPAGHDYEFETTGADAEDVWLAYGLTTAYVDFSTTGVRLALQTMIDGATLETATVTTTVVPGQTIDLYLAVSAPGGYSVPVADYTVAYAIDEIDGAVTASSNVGTRATATTTPVDDIFTLTATVTGWRNIDGTAVWNDGVSATFEKPYAIDASLSLDADAPTVTIDEITEPTTVGTAVTLGGTAHDDTGIDRIHLYEGPVLIGSSAANEYEAVDVEPINLTEGTWTTGWIPTEARTHTLTAVAIDTSGNEGRDSTSVDVAAEPTTTLTFVDGGYGFATLTAGQSVILEGTASSGFSIDGLSIGLFDFSNAMHTHVTKDGLVIADGRWTLAWTAPAAGTYLLESYYFDGPVFEYASFDLTVK